MDLPKAKREKMQKGLFMLKRHIRWNHKNAELPSTTLSSLLGDEYETVQALEFDEGQDETEENLQHVEEEMDAEDDISDAENEDEFLHPALWFV